MKYPRFIMLISFLSAALVQFVISACYYNPWPAKGYALFDLNHEYFIKENTPAGQVVANCKLWRQQTSANISDEDIVEVVYKSNLEQLRALRSEFDMGVIISFMNNKFANYILQNKDSTTIDFLILAKEIETARCAELDPWYFPDERGKEKMKYSDYADIAISRISGKYTDRYILQAARALTYAHSYEECINLWLKHKDQMKLGLLRDMTENYVGGAYYNLGMTDEAIEIFCRLGDTKSINKCFDEGKITIREKIIVSNRCNADSPKFLLYLNDEITNYEFFLNNFAELSPEHPFADSNDYRADQLSQLRDVALELADDPTEKNRSRWYYIAAYATDLLDSDAEEASRLLQKAEICNSNPELTDYIKVCRFYLDAKRLEPSDKTGETLLKHLVWLDNKSTDALKYEDPCSISWIPYNAEYNLKNYYWNDMMRKIVIGEILPKYFSAGKFNEALYFANFVESEILNKIAKIQNTDVDKLYHSYRNSYFTNLDTLDISKVIDFANHTPAGKLENFLAKVVDKNRLNDMVGTRLIRDLRFDEAEKYLKRLPDNYYKVLNTGFYLQLDPFTSTWDNTLPRSIKESKNPKLEFAATMAQLKNIADTSSDNNSRGIALIKYATGIRNMAVYCWALSYYSSPYDAIDFDVWEYEPWYMNKEYNMLSSQYKSRCFQRSFALKTLYEGLSLITDDEIKSRMLFELHKLNEVMTTYPETEAAKIIRNNCDTWADYFCE